MLVGTFATSTSLLSVTSFSSSSSRISIFDAMLVGTLTTSTSLLSVTSFSSSSSWISPSRTSDWSLAESSEVIKGSISCSPCCSCRFLSKLSSKLSFERSSPVSFGGVESLLEGFLFVCSSETNSNIPFHAKLVLSTD